MSDNSSSERRRREAIVKFGRQQIKIMEKERELRTNQGKIQQLLGMSHDLECRLEEIERRKQEEREDPGEEAARRQTVVKLWKLQVRLMERQRQLERMKRETEGQLDLVKANERKMELEEYKIQTSKGLIEESKLSLLQLGKGLEQLENFETDDQRKKSLRKTLKEVQVHRNQVWEKFVCQSYEKIVETVEVEVEVDYQLIQAKLQELQMEIEEDEEDAETLSQ